MQSEPKCGNLASVHRGLADAETLRRSIRFLVLSSIVLLICAEAAPGQMSFRPLSEYSARLYTIDEGLPQNEVRSIAQTPDGYLWFSTRDGLARFDGVHFTVFREETTPGLGHNMIDALLVDHRGRLWIATGDGLTCYEHGVFRHFGEQDGLPARGVHTLLEDRSGKLWIGTWSGLVVYDGVHFRIIRRKDGLPADSISSIAEDGAGGLWVGTYSGGLAHLLNGHVTISTEKDGLPGHFILVLLHDHSGRLWVGTLTGSALLTASGRFEPVRELPGRCFSLNEDREGNIWASTDKTFARLSNTPGSIFQREVGPHKDVDAVFEDQDGSLWVATIGSGVGCYRAGTFTSYTTREGLADNVTATLFQDSKGNIWVGGHGLTRRTNGRFHAVADSEFKNATIDSFAEDDNGDLWVATSNGTFRREGNVWKRVVAKSDIQHLVYLLYKDRAGRIWMGSLNELRIWDHGRTSSLTQLSGLPISYVTSVLEDREGAVWIGTISGLVRLDHGKITNYTTADGLRNNFVQSIYEDSEGTLWVCTEGSLHRFKNGRFRAFTMKDGMFADGVLQLIEDCRHRFWIRSFRGIFRVDRDDLHAVADGLRSIVQSIAYGTEDGIKSSAVLGPIIQSSELVAQDGCLLFATDQGVVEVNPSKLPTPISPPTPVLESIMVNGTPTSSTTIGPGVRRIDFQFTAPTSVQARAIEFRYRMQGYDDQWQLAGADRHISFTDLPQGAYKFFVSARRAGGSWSQQEACAVIKVIPHFYQTRLFYLATGLLAILLILMAEALRVRERERRITAIMAERSRVAQELHDTLLQSVSGTAMEIQAGLRQLSLGSSKLGIQQLS
ncbi:MAG: two-component regulator propeller domain-containing protein, partial [Terracidiphilus sp.]